MRVCTHVLMCVLVYARMNVYMCVCMCMCVLVYARMNVHICVCMNVCMHACTPYPNVKNVCIHQYNVYTYTHTQ